ncbi:unnamed protein product, partial [Didymodactylos carnosus]
IDSAFAYLSWLYYWLTFPSGPLTRVVISNVKGSSPQHLTYDTNTDLYEEAHERSRTQLNIGHEKFIRLSFGVVRYTYLNTNITKNSPLNVFVHGFSTGMDLWRDVATALHKQGQRCLVFDLYGRGWSDSPDIKMNAELFVNQIVELLYSLNITDKSFNLYGVSMGGVIVQLFTKLYPEKVSKLILCCPAGLSVNRPTGIKALLLSLPIIGPVVFKKSIPFLEKSAKLQWIDSNSELLQLYSENFRQCYRQHKGYLRSLYSSLIHFPWDTIQTIAQKINSDEKCPKILILWGDKDTMIDISDAHRYHKLYNQNSTLVIIPNANHSFLVEQSDAAISAIVQFLNL